MENQTNLERQEVFCTECQQYVQFDVDLSLNGNHTVKCPNCGHEHYRVVRNGRITEDCWDPTFGHTYHYMASNVTSTATSVYYTCNMATGNNWTTDSWVQYSTGTAGYI